MKKFKFVLLILAIVKVSLCSEPSEYFSSITGLESLLQTEAILLLDIKEYLETAKQQINALEIEINKIDDEHKSAIIDTENYVTNPINAYRLIKRLYTDWHKHEDRLRQNDVGAHFLERMTQNRDTLSFPSQEDVDGSAIALVRLQETYQLDVTQVAAGILNGIKYGTDMSWQDCLMLGQQLLAMEDYNHTKMWLKESMNRLSKENYSSEPISLDMMEGVAENLFSLGDLEAALNISNHILMLDPERTKAGHIKQLVLESDHLEAPTLTSRDNSYHHTVEFKLYEQLCRGELTATPAQLRPLRCRYISNKDPYHIIAPFKVEEHNLDPLVMTFHDVLSEHKINTLKEMSIPYMKRSTVNSPGGGTKSQYRVSKNAWLNYDWHEYMGEMLRDLHGVTGLDMTYCEELQIANYGLGGHYEPHWDFFSTESQIKEVDGNRIATAIFYFSDVEQGGSTAFPFLQTSVKPKKGNVLFFYNLHRSLDKDYRTKHAGCPVLKGSKWIANVWIHERTQAFTRPCIKYRDNEISLKYDTPILLL